jgi:hypothetical protein
MLFSSLTVKDVWESCHIKIICIVLPSAVKQIHLSGRGPPRLTKNNCFAKYIEAEQNKPKVKVGIVAYLWFIIYICACVTPRMLWIDQGGVETDFCCLNTWANTREPYPALHRSPDDQKQSKCTEVGEKHSWAQTKMDR